MRAVACCPLVLMLRPNLDRELVTRMVGVIDLQGGCAVHGIAGNRNEYRVTDYFHDTNGARILIDGDYRRLVDCYRDVGIDSLYVADLDGIRLGRWQRQHVEWIVRSMETQGRLLLDLGFNEQPSRADWDWIHGLVKGRSNLTLVVATECAADATLLGDLIRHVPREQAAVSFDYKDSRWMSTAATEDDWIAACRRHKIATVIGLDLAAVGGTSIEPTLALCHRLRASLPQTRYITGGGIRTDFDARQLFQAGADELLVASWFTGRRGPIEP